VRLQKLQQPPHHPSGSPVRPDSRRYEGSTLTCHRPLNHDAHVCRSSHKAESAKKQRQYNAELARLEREAAAGKVQLEHQRDVLLHKLEEAQAAEKLALEREEQVLQMKEGQQTSISDLRTVIFNLRELEKANTGTIIAQRTEIDGLHGRFREMSRQLAEAEQREADIKEHFRAVGEENHVTIQALTQDMRFLIKKREDDYTNLTNQKAIEVASWRRANDNLSGQLLRFRQGIHGQLEHMNRRLTKARLLISRAKAAKGSGITPREGGPASLCGPTRPRTAQLWCSALGAIARRSCEGGAEILNFPSPDIERPHATSDQCTGPFAQLGCQLHGRRAGGTPHRCRGAVICWSGAAGDDGQQRLVAGAHGALPEGGVREQGPRE
jgi:hypothetical protein